jgi:tetratricopeptide (TPR) repeat protein
MASSKPRDLIGDIHRQHRRKVLRRAAAVTTLAIILLLIGIALKLFQDRRNRDQVLESARSGFASGTAMDLRSVVDQLEAGLEEHPGDPWLMSSLALARAQQLAEFGEEGSSAREATLALSELSTHDGELARSMLALDEGRLEDAAEALTAASSLESERSISPGHSAWVAGMLAIVDPEADIPAAIESLSSSLGQDASISSRRLLATLHMHSGDGHAALDELGRARERSVKHAGMAADEALYNAVLRQNLGGVASVAEQLEDFELSARDRAHADLARGVVHIRLGETDDGLERIETAWSALPAWDKLSRSLALEMAMEAGAGRRAEKWIDEAGLSVAEANIFRAWVSLIDGDVMAALADLSELPQEHPRVALLQGLALVEQGRWVEAADWLARADKLMPGRIDVEVARARAELHAGDAAAALRKLEGLAEEEPHAPRAWTGLGEAYMVQGEAETGTSVDRAESRRLAKRAFEKAVKREPYPGAAYLQLGEIANARRAKDPMAARQALEYFEKAVEVGDKLPRYRERLVAHLSELGYQARALEMMDDLLERPGVGHETHSLALHLLVAEAIEERRDTPKQLDEWIDGAESAGANPRLIAREEARSALIERDRSKMESALAEVDQLLAEQADDTETRIVYVRLLMALGEKERAAAAVRRGLQTSPASQHGRLHMEWARIESRSGSRRKAASHARAAWLKIKAEDRPPAEILDAADAAVRFYNRDKKPKPALAVARDLVERVPYHSRAWTIRGRAQLKAAEAADARTSLERALELDEMDPVAHELMGRCQLRFGYKDRARESFERAIELVAGTPREKEYRENLKRL